MAGKKYYAVRKGKETGIFRTWTECKTSVYGYSGAEYKGFALLEEAEAYLKNGKESKSKVSAESNSKDNFHELPGGVAGALRGNAGEEQSSGATENAVEGDRREIPEQGTLLAYVDGSYDDSIKKYAFGCVFITPDGIVETECGNGDNAQSLQHRNVTGEMLGAMYAVKVAIMSGFSRIEICYDYQGIEKWVTGEWRSKTQLTRKYADAMREWGKEIEICFTKVAAHTNVYYNELADKMAKTGLREGNGIPRVRKVPGGQ